DPGRYHAGELADQVLHAPETAAGEDGLLGRHDALRVSCAGSNRLRQAPSDGRGSRSTTGGNHPPATTNSPGTRGAGVLGPARPTRPPGGPWLRSPAPP